MKQTKIIILLLALAVAGLSGCDHGGSGLPPQEEKPTVEASFESSIPYHQQDQVPVSARIILFFNEVFDPNTAVNLLGLERKTEAGEFEAVEFVLETGPQTMTLLPSQLLTGNTVYRVRMKQGLATFDGRPILLPERKGLVSFRTCADRPLADSTPELMRLLPSGDRVRDFSTFHLSFNEPLDRNSIMLGQTVLFTDEDDQPVPAHLRAKFSQIIIDPIEDLVPGRTYKITVTTDVVDLDGFGPDKKIVLEVRPTSTRPLHDLVVEACPTAGPGSSCDGMSLSELPVSALTGKPANSMITFGKVLGESYTYMSGPLFSSLGNSGLSEANLIPVVLRKGQTIKSTNINALLGGKIPSGLETGEISLTLITDANGFIEDASNDATTTGLRPRVKLIMDAALNAENPKANASFSQEILGVELSGYSVVDPDTGVMRMELGGVSEIWVMGERVGSMLTMYQVAPNVFPEFEPDNKSPEVMTVTPIDESELVPTGTAIVVHFDKPINADTIYEAASLIGPDDQKVPAVMHAEGGKIVLRPKKLLEPLTTYQIKVTTSLMDQNGNALAHDFNSTFTTNAKGYGKLAPRIGTTAPATEYGSEFPCNLEPMLFFTADIEKGTVVYGESVSLIDLATGELVEATPIVDYRQITIRPAKYLTPDKVYRIELTPGIQDIAGKPLDTDNDLTPGGHFFQLDFTATEYLDVTVLVLHADPVADPDGNGEVIPRIETETPSNQIDIDSVLIYGTSYVSGDMVSFVHGLTETADGQVYLDIDLGGGIALAATSVGLDIDTLLELLGLLGKDSITALTPIDMGLISIDVIRPGKAPIFYNDFDSVAEMNIAMDTYMSVTNGLFNALITHELPLNQVGRLSFIEDGRMEVIIEGKSEIKMLDMITLPANVKMRTISDQAL